MGGWGGRVGNQAGNHVATVGDGPTALNVQIEVRKSAEAETLPLSQSQEPYKMPRGVLAQDGVRKIVLHMHRSLGLSASEIVHLTNVPQRTIYRMLAAQREEEAPQHQVSETRGRPRKLDFADTQVYPLC